MPPRFNHRIRNATTRGNRVDAVEIAQPQQQAANRPAPLGADRARDLSRGMHHAIDCVGLGLDQDEY